MNQQKLTPNKPAILSHLRFLFENTGDESSGWIEISNTPPNDRALNTSKYFLITELEDAANYAVERNSIEGVNVYVGAALRHTDTPLFKRSNIDFFGHSNFVWVDLDDGGAAQSAKDKYKDMPPSCVVVTGRHPELRAQLWWRLDSTVTTPTDIKPALAAACSFLNGDKSVVDPIRVMRLGGTVAWPKKDGRIPELTEFIIPQQNTVSVSLDAFKGYFRGAESASPLLTTKASAHPEVGFNRNYLNLSSQREFSQDEIRSMLYCIRPDCSYADWLAVGMALKDYGIPFDVFDGWSSGGGEKYKGSNDCLYHWNSFNKTGTTIGTLVKMARDAGYHKNIVEERINDVLNKHNKSPESKYEQINNDPKDAHDNDAKKDHENTGEPKTEDQPKNKFYYTNAPDIGIDLEVNDFVQGLLTENAMSVVYGESNCGKTFFMSDLAFHVSQGKKYNGRRVEKGNVLYLSLEGKRGIKNRISAYKMENNVDLDGFLMMPCQVDFINSEDDIPQLVDLIMDANKKFNHNIKLVVVDTLARAIGGGDENSGVDMGTLVKHSDLIRQYTNAHICFIHHSGKDKARGARGHSSLRAAVDTEIEISRTEGADYSVVKIPKQRDMDRDDDFCFKLKRVVLGLNKWMEEVTSCTVEPYDIKVDTEANAEKRIKSGKTKTAYDALKEAIMEKGFRGTGPEMPNCKVITIDIFKRYLQKRGVLSDNPASQRKQFERVHDDLIENKLIVVRDDYVWIPGHINVV